MSKTFGMPLTFYEGLFLFLFFLHDMYLYISKLLSCHDSKLRLVIIVKPERPEQN